VRRAADPTDRRASHISLTEAGERLVNEGLLTHVAGLRARFLDRFSEAELIQLAGYWDRLAVDPTTTTRSPNPRPSSAFVLGEREPSVPSVIPMKETPLVVRQPCFVPSSR